MCQYVTCVWKFILIIQIQCAIGCQDFHKLMSYSLRNVGWKCIKKDKCKITIMLIIVKWFNIVTQQAQWWTPNCSLISKIIDANS